MGLEKIIKDGRKLASPLFIATALSLNACSIGALNNREYLDSRVQPSDKQVNEAMKILNVQDVSQLGILRNSKGKIYIMRERDKDLLRLTAGIYCGSINIFIKREEIIMSGYYSQSKNPEPLDSVLKRADKNYDKIITEKEAKDIYKKVLYKRIKESKSNYSN